MGVPFNGRLFSLFGAWCGATDEGVDDWLAEPADLEPTTYACDCDLDCGDRGTCCADC